MSEPTAWIIPIIMFGVSCAFFYSFYWDDNDGH